MRRGAPFAERVEGEVVRRRPIRAARRHKRKLR
jgi:hypothetical protein